ncbi:MAG: hypothetical protein WCK51_03425 [Armatimonadota bacterium]
MRRFSALLPLLLVWGCSPQKDEQAISSAPPATEATSSEPAPNPPVTPEPGKSDPVTKAEPNKPAPAAPSKPKETPIPPPIPGPAQSGFKPTPNNAVTTLAAVDAQMKRMRDVELTQRVRAVYPVGKGSAELISRIKGPNDVLLRYANLEPIGSNFNFVQYTEVRKDGKSQTLVGQKYEPGHRLPSGNILETWPKNFSHHLLNNFGDGKANTLSDLARAAAKAGWTTAVETKKFDTGTFQRVILTSKSKPKRTYTILIEPDKKLPMELQMDVDDTKKTRVTAALRWRQSDKPLTPKDLDPKVETAPHVGGEMGKKSGI